MSAEWDTLWHWQSVVAVLNQNITIRIMSQRRNRFQPWMLHRMSHSSVLYSCVGSGCTEQESSHTTNILWYILTQGYEYLMHVPIVAAQCHLYIPTCHYSKTPPLSCLSVVLQHRTVFFPMSPVNHESLKTTNSDLKTRVNRNDMHLCELIWTFCLRRSIPAHSFTSSLMQSCIFIWIWKNILNSKPNTDEAHQKKSAVLKRKTKQN